ncbi:hypothetical protein EK21DRAFT_74457 [Setomelanomma holmii]|uniref:Heterokaryon incompatibility domain-containing protein n=1 Tax=Setomelanomma holmii TaxID=210430 RepID=A0A9P4H127_9PLEO|nr:hypothetical protein EK21DRAFT_74457 [Setomelanomma holmii]
MKSNQYQYRLLEGPKAICLVAVQSARRSNQALHLTILYASLDDYPPYAALSCEWRNERPWRLIDVDESSSILVTSNCFGALIRLRLKKGWHIHWVDAICINQEDVQERNAQVSMMINIYQHADRTIVWLGNDSLDSQRVLRFLSRASFFYRHSCLQRL